ncbi:hypothetical protein K9M48_02465 [Candidatus Gracilibacteria bacterium]|nr:hypothetical protein [Candidatus Gracilibacteria bacterium]
MGQGFERLNNRKPDYSSRDKFFEGAKQIKSKVLNFFSFIQKNFIHHHHTKKAVHHIRKHHKKYIFGSTIGFLIIKILITLLTTVGGGALAQESNNQFFIGDGIISQYEQCDDQNLENGDGCNSAGQIEEGSTCIGEPSICATSSKGTPAISKSRASIIPSKSGDLIIPKTIEKPIEIQTGDIDESITDEPIDQPIIDEPVIDQPIIIPAPDEPIPDESPKKQSPKIIKNPDSDSDNIDLINSLYGSSSQYISTRDSNKCNISDMNVVYLQPGENQIPNYLSANTIYALAPGLYSNKYMININFDCSALIGLDRGAILYTNNSKGATIKISSGSNIIIQNLILHGSQTIAGDLHSGNNYGIFIDSPYNTISNIKTYDNIGFSIYLENFDNDISNISKITENKIYKLIGAVNYPLIIPDTADTDIISQSLHDGEYILSGTTRRGFRPLNLALSSVLFQSMDMYSVDQSIKLSLPANSQFISSGDIRFTGIFLSPKNISTPITQSQFTNEKVIYAFKLGIQDQSLYLHDLDNNPIKSQVSIDIPSSGDLSSLFVYYSQDGISRENIGPVK